MAWSGVSVTFRTIAISRHSTGVRQVTTDEHGQTYVSLIDDVTYHVTVEYHGSSLEKKLTRNGGSVLLILLDPNADGIMDFNLLTSEPHPQQSPVRLLLTN